MRVYEISKKLNIPSKELIDALVKEGFEVASHMAALSEDAVLFLHKKFDKKNLKSAPSAISKKSVQKKPVRPTKVEPSAPKVKKPIEQAKPASDVLELKPMSVGNFARFTGLPVSEVILFLLRRGHMYAVNQVIDEELVQELADNFELPVERKVAVETQKEGAELKKIGGAQKRLPVVVVVGHVDHGKTTLLDHIRKTRVVSREKGGITQHIGAYKAHTDHGDIVFLDTPGHAAFSQIRSRGVRVADIAILVVAADDSVKPQTIEAIKHAKAADIPVVVAINKIDKAEPAQIERVKQDLSQYDLLPEEWGGQVVCVPVSAKTGKGIDQLLEIILLQADIMDLAADTNKPAAGVVLESRIEKGRGPVATVLCHQGTLKVGDYFSAGHTTGKVSSMVDSFGKRVSKIGPSEPVRVAGFATLPNAGDYFEAVSKDKVKALKSGRMLEPATPKQFEEGAIHLIIKTDTNSSKEALLGALARLAKKADKKINIVHAAVGNVTESDVTLATNTGAHIYGLHVKPEPNAAVLARKNMLPVALFDIIYKLLEQIEEISKAPEEIKKVSQKIGEAVVLRVFDIKNLGVIAGCIVKDGRFSHDGTVVVYRGRQKVGKGKIKSLQRERKTVKEVHAGFECGFLVEGFNEFQVDDRVECYLDVPVSK